MNISKIIALEYSLSQGCFHRSFLSQVIEHNLQAVLLKQPNDYLLIGIFNTAEECDSIIIRLETVMCKDRPVQFSDLTIDQLLQSI